MKSEKLVLFNSSDGEVELAVQTDEKTVWLSQTQMATLFAKNRTVISRHISNAFTEGEVDREGNVHFLHVANSDKPVAFYSLDVIISVGYRVKSQRGVEFRRWATDILHRYIVDGVAENKRRLEQLGQVVNVLDRISNDVNAQQILDIVKSYTPAFDMLDDFDHQKLVKPEGTRDVYELTYEECQAVIASMRYGETSDLFGREKDETFKSSIGAIYQGFEGCELYPTAEEKAAHLLYFVIKNHSFYDGNKRIGACLFLYFLNRCGLLVRNDKPRISNEMLVAMTLMIAESRPEEMESMIALVMNFLAR